MTVMHKFVIISSCTFFKLSHYLGIQCLYVWLFCAYVYVLPTYTSVAEQDVCPTLEWVRYPGKISFVPLVEKKKKTVQICACIDLTTSLRMEDTCGWHLKYTSHCIKNRNLNLCWRIYPQQEQCGPTHGNYNFAFIWASCLSREN